MKLHIVSKGQDYVTSYENDNNQNLPQSTINYRNDKPNWSCKANSNRFRGVTRHRSKYQAQITHNGKYIYIGLFRSEVTAARAYDRLSRKLHREQGKTNFKPIKNEPLQLTIRFQNPIRLRRTSIKLIARANKEGWIKHLAFYHMLKFHFSNGCIYSYKSRMDELAGKFNVSTKTLYNYIDILRQKEMVYEHSGNLVILSIRPFRARKKSTIKIDIWYDLFDITCLLYGKLIEKKARQQAFAESVRRFGRGDRFNSVPCVNPFLPSMSFRTIAKLLDISESKAFIIITNLNKLGVIKSHKQKPQLISSNYTNLKSIEDMPGYRYNIGKRLFEQFGNRIEFLQFRISLPKITIRQFKKYNISDL